MGIVLLETTSAKTLYSQQKSMISIQVPLKVKKKCFPLGFYHHHFSGWDYYWGRVTKVEIPHSGVNSGEKKYASRWGPVNMCSLDGIIPADV